MFTCSRHKLTYVVVGAKGPLLTKHLVRYTKQHVTQGLRQLNTLDFPKLDPIYPFLSPRTGE